MPQKDPNQDIHDAMQGSFAAQQSRDPRLAGVTLEPMGALEKWWVNRGRKPGDMVDATYRSKFPWQNDIHYNPESIRQGLKDKSVSIDALVAHELDHARQRAQSGYLQNLWNTVKEGFSPYGLGPMESSAFMAENSHPMQRRDVELPPQSIQALKRQLGK